MLIDGIWQDDWHPVQSKDEDGRFVRQQSKFRNWVTPDGTAGPTGVGGYKAEAGRYRLYVALICPWASRTLIARKLKGLDAAIPVTVVNPRLTDLGWAFGGFAGADDDPLFGSSHLHELYTRADPKYTGRATVPVLWDTQKNTIVSNESADILRMFNTAFDGLDTVGPNLYPTALASTIDALNIEIYGALNNGVYRAGFASTQQAYEEANSEIFQMLDRLDDRLSDGRTFLFGGEVTESDIRLFVTLIRFDVAYHGLFKTNLKRIADYTHLYAFLKSILDLQGVRETVNVDHIKAGYYSVKALNPLKIVPAGPDLSDLGV